MKSRGSVIIKSFELQINHHHQIVLEISVKTKLELFTKNLLNCDWKMNLSNVEEINRNLINNLIKQVNILFPNSNYE